MARKIEVVPHNPDWNRLFAAEAGRLQQALGEQALAIYHIGSTAIPGIPAKPTVDILLEVGDIQGLDAADPEMIALGYEPRGEYGISGRRYYVKRSAEVHLVHVHAFQSGHPEIRRHLDFIRYLQTHPADAREYGELKAQLAQKFPYDSERYTEGKSELIQELDRRAKSMNVDNQRYLKEDQYRTSTNLEARIALHKRFGTNPYGWFRFVCDHLALQPGWRVLEVGCGPGSLWLDQKARLPEGIRLFLGDLSYGMATTARRNLAGQVPADFLVLDAQAIPFPAGFFDLVVANHMLYHVPNINQAASEIARVLRPGGRLVAATNGLRHMQELRDLLQRVLPLTDLHTSQTRRFALENAAGILAHSFPEAQTYAYDEHLEVTEVEPLVAYVHSMGGLYRPGMTDVEQPLEAEIRRSFTESEGMFYITKSQGVVVGEKTDKRRL